MNDDGDDYYNSRRLGKDSADGQEYIYPKSYVYKSD
jgi:hypothetical protein